MSAQIIPFTFKSSTSREVRTLLIDEQPWFVAADVAAALEYRDAGNMARNLDDDEKGTQIVSTPGGEQDMLVINESGLYSAILRSRKAEAKRFKKWVTAEVLPSIRKTGGYQHAAPDYTRQRLHDARQAYVDWTWAARDAMNKACITPPEWPSTLDKDADIATAVAADLLQSQRWLVGFDHNMKMNFTPVPSEACVMTTKEFMGALVEPNGMAVSSEELFEFAAAILANLKARSAYQAHSIKQYRDAAKKGAHQ